MQQVKAGIKAIYLSGWQVAADNNSYMAMYPDQSLYPVDSVPKVVERINATFKRADEIQCSRGIHPGHKEYVDFFAPIVADAEAGFGGVLNAFELMKAMIRAGAAGVHFEDQLASVKKCGHMGGKVLVPTQEAIQKLVAARFAADVMGMPTIVLARTDAEAADLLTSDVDENDKPFCTGERTPEGFYRVKPGVEQSISRGLAYAPYADMVWCETGKPDLGFAKAFAEAIRKKFPDKLLAYNCSPSFNWKKNLDDATIAQVPARAGRDGLQVPVHHAGRHPQHVVQHVRPHAGIREDGHDGLRREGAGARVRGRAIAATRSCRTSRRSAPATSTRSPRSSRAATRRPPRCTARPKRSSSPPAATTDAAAADRARPAGTARAVSFRAGAVCILAASEGDAMHYDKIIVPADGQPITVNRDGTHRRAGRADHPVPRGRRHRRRRHAGDAGRGRRGRAQGLRRPPPDRVDGDLRGREGALGLRSRGLVSRRKRSTRCREYVVSIKGPLAHADRRRHPLAQRRDAAEPRPLRLRAPDPLLPGRRDADGGRRATWTW